VESFRAKLYVLFCLSGFVGVLAEQVFEKMLSVVVGASTPAAATVLAVYFLGLCLGGYLATCLVKRGLSALVGYALAELGVALCCLGLLWFFNPGSDFYTGLLAWGAASPWKVITARAAVAASMILPTAICLGLSFPFLSSVAARFEQDATYYLAKLYCANLVGAAFCAIAAPFGIFPAIGLSGALTVCALIDAVVAGYAWRLSPGGVPVASGRRETAVFRWEMNDALILTVAFVSGLLFFALEVIWSHLVGVVVGTSVYAFSSMLFVVLVGLAVGGLRIARKVHAGASPVRLHGLFFLCAGTLLTQVALWPLGPEGIMRLANFASGFYSGELVRLAVLVGLLLPATCAYGMVYPSLFQQRRFEQPGSGLLVGYMTAANALGCVIGAMLATFFLIPHLGSEWTLRFFTVLLTLCGIAVLWVERDRKNLRDAFIAASVIFVLAMGLPRWSRRALTSGAGVYFNHGAIVAASPAVAPTPGVVSAATPTQNAPVVAISEELTFFHEHSNGGMTTVVETRQTGIPTQRTLYTNGKFQGDDQGQQDAQVAFALIPSLHLKTRRDALVIGLGTGQSAAVVSGLDFRAVDVAEISPGIPLAAEEQFSHLNENVLHSPKVTVHLEDGRNLLLTQPKLYDQVTIEISSIWFAGSTNLYSHEFYELAKRRLAPGGVLQQWFQLHHISPREIESIIGTVHASFPYVSAWVFGGQGILLATLEPQGLQQSAVEVALQYLRTHSADEADAQRKLKEILASRFLDTDATRRLAQTRSPVINTDWNRWIEFSTPRYNADMIDWYAINFGRLASLSSSGGSIPGEVAGGNR